MFTILVISENCQASEMWFQEMSRLRTESSTTADPWDLYVRQTVPSQISEDVNLILVDIYRGKSEPEEYRDELLEICRQIRARTNKVILLHSPIRSERFAVAAYAVGIDEYVLKPTSAPLLLAKLEAWQRWIETYPLLS